MKLRCDHVHLRSRRALEAASFYVEALGARQVGVEGSPVSRVVLDLGGLTIFIEQAPDGLAAASRPPHLGIEHIGLAVDDIDAAAASLRRRGVPIVSGITDVRPGVRVLFIDGPDGARIELLERSTPTS